MAPNKTRNGKILSAQLKVYWKPELSIIRQHGSFRARVYDIIKPEIESMLDVQKINHKCAVEDEGNKSLFTTGNMILIHIVLTYINKLKI